MRKSPTYKSYVGIRQRKQPTEPVTHAWNQGGIANDIYVHIVSDDVEFCTGRNTHLYYFINFQGTSLQNQISLPGVKVEKDTS